MEGTIRELVVKRLDSQIRRLRSAKRKLNKRLLEDPKLDNMINQLVSIRRRLTLHNTTEAKSDKQIPRTNPVRPRTGAKAKKTEASI